MSAAALSSRDDRPADGDGPWFGGSPIPVLVATSDHPELPAALARLARSGPALLITEDREAVPAGRPPGLMVIEPEELLPEGVRPIEEGWDRGASAYFERLFPQKLDEPLGELLWCAAFLKPALLNRCLAVAFARALFARVRMASLHLLGPLPHPLCDTLAAEARARGLPVHQELAGHVRQRADELLYWPRGFLTAGALGAMSLGRSVRRWLGRRRAMTRLAEQMPGPAAHPRLWLAVSQWIQPSRHLVETVLAPCAARGIPVGLLFVTPFGAPPSGGTVDEIAYLDGRLFPGRPAAVDQAAGSTEPFDLLRDLAHWLPWSARSVLGCLRHGRSFRVNGAIAALPGDLPGLLRLATEDLLRVIETHRAAERWLARHPESRTLVFAQASLPEPKTVDVLAQRHGLTTVDYIHAHVGESDLRTAFRSRSTYLVAWTEQETVRFRRLGTNRHVVGGYLPRRRQERRPDARPRILAAPSYLQAGNRETQRRYLKYARRLAQALIELAAHLGERAEVVLRPHPLDDRQAWRALLGGAAPSGPAPVLSDERQYSADLGRSHIVILSNSSTIVEALAYDIPVLVQRGPVVEADSLVALVPPERSFASGRELIERVEAILQTPDLGPEHMLRQACFGPRGEPAEILTLLDRIGDEKPSRSELPRSQGD
jgi:hypothetical protein